VIRFVFTNQTPHIIQYRLWFRAYIFCVFNLKIMVGMSQNVCVVGVVMIPFAKPGASELYPMMGARATRAALADAGLDYDKIQQVYAGYVYGDACSGQRAVYDVGMSSVPVINVNNNCSTGWAGWRLCRYFI
jgi:acetyl-CoA acetyltransferase